MNRCLGYLLLFFLISTYTTGTASTSISPEATPNTSTDLTANNVPELNFSCIGKVFVTVGEDCTAPITIPMVLKGEGVDEIDNYSVVVRYPNQSISINEVKTCGEFTYEVYDEFDQFVCWGTIQAEDKTPPQIELPTKPDTLICTDVDSILNRDLIDLEGTVWQRLKDKGIFDVSTFITDNCSSFEEMTYNIQDSYLPSEEPCEEIGKIVRTIQFEDSKGNVSDQVEILFVFNQPEILTDLIKDTLINKCSDGTTIELTREEAGAPYYINSFGDTLFIYDADSTFCNYGIFYEDDSLASNCGYKIIRTWGITDWCDTESGVENFQQLIKYGDFEAPEVFCPQFPQIRNVFNTDPFDCTASFDIPAPTVRDCSSNWSYAVEVYSRLPELDGFGLPTGDTILVQQTVVTGNPVEGYYVNGLDVGEHYFYYYVNDNCGNIADTLKCFFYVNDEIEPNPVCVDLVNTALNGDGIATVGVNDIDEGSSDNCELVERKIRRIIVEDCLDGYVDALLSEGDGLYSFADLSPNAEETEWYYDDELIISKSGETYYSAYLDEVVLTCCDVGGQVTIELKIEDKYGNTNECWSFAIVEDKLAPRCIDPDPVVVSCDTHTLDRNNYGDTVLLQGYYGMPVFEDNCNAIVIEYTPVINVDNCGFGTIDRSFRAIDEFGNESGLCTQQITILESFDYEIKFPADAENLVCGEVESDTIEVRNIACGALAINVEEDEFPTNDDACYKLLRKYSVINWCEYVEGDDPVVISRDEDQDEIVGEEVYLLRRSDGSYYIDDDNDETNGFITSGSNSPGFWEYTQVIKVYDNIQPTIADIDTTIFCSYDNITSPDDICNGYVELPILADDNCNLEVLTVSALLDVYADGVDKINVTGTDALVGEANQYVFSGEYPIGRHKLEVRVVDGCGNFRLKAFDFEVIDCKAPAPICNLGRSVVLMPVDQDGNGIPDFGMNTIPAVDFVGSDVYDCSGSISYSINRRGEEPARDKTFIEVNCLDPLFETIPVELHAWDDQDNHSFCETFVIVTDNQNLCSGGVENGLISGFISTMNDQPMENVEVQLSGNSNTAVTTNIDGAFSFANLTEGEDYSVAPVSDIDYTNGVSTFDLVLISKHILGVQQLSSPYELIAADVNASGSITTLDLIHLRKLILSVNDSFPNNTSWRFIDSDYTFFNPDNPFKEDFPEVISVNDLIASSDPVNFKGLKVGDINLSARASSLVEDSRTEIKRLELNHEEEYLTSGNRYSFALNLPDEIDLETSQFTIDFNPDLLSLEDLTFGLAQEANLGLSRVDDGFITLSWNKAIGALPSEEKTLLTLHFRAKQSTSWSESVSLNSRYTTAEAYDLEGNSYLPVLAVKSAKQSFEPILHQNQPNPFSNTTSIRFELAEEDNVTLEIRDLQGRTYFTSRNRLNAGLQRIEITEDLPSGVLIYTLSTSKHQLSRKMIVL
ncbi:MAG: T9SS type A sorting domain-containing protein [Bacteroidota bacterium]